MNGHGPLGTRKVSLDNSKKRVVVVLRSPIHANEPSEYNGMLYRSSNRVLNSGIKVIILICMDGTSQYHHYQKKRECDTGCELSEGTTSTQHLCLSTPRVLSVIFPLSRTLLSKLIPLWKWMWRHTGRAVANLTVPGGQGFHFPHFFLKFRSIFLIFPQTLLIFFLILVLWVGDWSWLGHCIPALSHVHKCFDRDFLWHPHIFLWTSNIVHTSSLPIIKYSVYVTSILEMG